MKYMPVTDFENVDIKSVDLMTKFLRRNFPIKRIKTKKSKRFKRGIIIDKDFTFKSNIEYTLTPYSESKQLFTTLNTVLTDVFHFDSNEIALVIYQYLYL